MGIKRSRTVSPTVLERNEELLRLIRDIKADHPFWGYRRIWAYLRYKLSLKVNQKRIYRLLKTNNLLVKPNLRLLAKRKVNTSKPKPTKLNEWWGIDMTKIMIDSFGWVYVVLVMDWHTKKIVGHYAGIQCKAKHWLEALDEALNKQFPNGVKEQKYKLNLMSDNGSQPTAVSFIKACSDLGVNQAFTSYNNPKGNADTERMMRTLKEELVWINEWKSPQEFFNKLGCWIKYYNNEYLHSSLKYKTPAQFENEERKILLAAA